MAQDVVAFLVLGEGVHRDEHAARKRNREGSHRPIGPVRPVEPDSRALADPGADEAPRQAPRLVVADP